MADNVVANPGAGGATFATDDDGTAQHPYVKIEWGADNTQTKVGTGANAVPIQDGGNSITVDGAVTVSGTATVSGAVTANAGTNLNTSLLALEAGGNLASIKAKTDNIPAQGQALAAASLPIVLTAAQITTLTPPAAITGFATEATLAANTGALTETAPATDTASSGLNGRLQRIAQRLTSLIALFPTALGGTTSAASFPVVLSSDGPFATQTGSITETAPATDTASSGLNGRLQRIAQRLTSLIALLPAALVSGRLDVNLGAAPATVTITGTVTAGGSGKTLKTAVVSLTASGNVIAAVSGKILKVYSLEIQSISDTMTVQVLDDLAGTVQTCLYSFNAREGVNIGPISPPNFLFKNSAQNKPIYANLTGSGTVKITARYWDDDTS